MISATDSFISYLSTELANNPPVKWVRRSADREDSHLLQENALNVSVLDVTQNGSEEELLVSLDILGVDERTVFNWMKRVSDVLEQTQYTPELDYATTPETPVAMGRNISWDRDETGFSVVGRSERLVHANATFPICHVRF